MFDKSTRFLKTSVSATLAPDCGLTFAKSHANSNYFRDFFKVIITREKLLWRSVMTTRDQKLSRSSPPPPPRSRSVSNGDSLLSFRKFSNHGDDEYPLTRYFSQKAYSLRPRPNVELFMRRSKLSELSS